MRVSILLVCVLGLLLPLSVAAGPGDKVNNFRFYSDATCSNEVWATGTMRNSGECWAINDIEGVKAAKAVCNTDGTTITIITYTDASCTTQFATASGNSGACLPSSTGQGAARAYCTSGAATLFASFGVLALLAIATQVMQSHF